jgi:hypothetical protein
MVDMVFLDGHKDLYLLILKMLNLICEKAPWLLPTISIPSQ